MFLQYWYQGIVICPAIAYIILRRALVIIVSVAIVFWALSYSSDGDITHSVIYRIGTFIEPVTMWFGLRWQMFMAFVASGMGKGGSLGVLTALFNLSDSGVWSSIANQVAVDTTALGGTMLTSISKAEALAFLYAFFFNIPCLSAATATAHESHSLKWTLRIAAYYICIALLMPTIAYHIGLLIF